MIERVNDRPRKSVTSRRTLFLQGAAALSAAALTPATVRAAQFEFRSASSLPADHASSIRSKEMWAAIERESGGQLRTQYFPQNMLGGDAGLFQQLREGAIQFMLISPGNLASVVPATDISFLGFAYKDPDEAMRVLGGPLGDYLRSQAAVKGIRMFRSWWDIGMFQIGSNVRPIKTADDLRDFKLRVVEGRITIDLFKAFGSSPVALNFGDVYTALQTKLLDGVAAPLGIIEKARFFEVLKYVSLTNHAWGGVPMVANATVWTSLGPKLQEIVDRNSQKYAMLTRADSKEADASLVTQLTGQGVMVNQVDQTLFRAPLRAYFESWENTFGRTEWALLERGLGRKIP